jgi:hypothetical protein
MKLTISPSDFVIIRPLIARKKIYFPPWMKMSNSEQLNILPFRNRPDRFAVDHPRLNDGVIHEESRPIGICSIVFSLPPTPITRPVINETNHPSAILRNPFMTNHFLLVYVLLCFSLSPTPIPRPVINETNHPSAILRIPSILYLHYQYIPYLHYPYIWQLRNHSVCNSISNHV